MLAPLPDDLRLVLRRTAVLDAFRADLAAAVTGRPDAPELLARAEREQLFVVPLDDRGDWYRFHHLFTEVLRDDLAHAEPGLAPRLHARAARWLADHDQPVEAVRHALAGDDRALAAALVARHAPVLTRIGQVETALGWFRALGDDTCRADPRLAVARALTGAHTGRPHEIVLWTAIAERALDDPPPGHGPTPAEETGARIEIAMMRWSAAIFAGDAAAGLRHVTDAMRLLPSGSGTPSAHILLALGSSQFRTGAVDESWTTLLQAESAAEHRGEHLAVVSARGMRALQAALGRRPEEATRLAASAEAVAQRHGLIEHVNTAALWAAQGWVALHDRRPRRAARALPALAGADAAGRPARGGRGAAQRDGGGRGAPRMARAGAPAPRRGVPGPRPLPGPGPPRGPTPATPRRRPAAAPDGDRVALSPPSDRDPAAARRRPDHRGDRRAASGQPADGGGAPADPLPQARRALPHRRRPLRRRERAGRTDSTVTGDTGPANPRPDAL